MRIGVFYGTCSGITGGVAQRIAEAFEADEVVNMEEDFDSIEQLLSCELLFLGSSTWGQGDVQRDWVDPLLEISDEELDFSGKTIALFGAGDCKTHGEHFVSALGKMYDLFKERGASFVGFFPTEGYTFEASLALKDGMFCGLPFDEINEPEQTQARVEAWIAKVKEELKR